jgi:hypothetical protein
MIRLTDEQWERIRNHFPEEHIADGRPGRKPIPTRRVVESRSLGARTARGGSPSPQLRPFAPVSMFEWARTSVLSGMMYSKSGSSPVEEAS